jgi:hypothetical protein
VDRPGNYDFDGKFETCDADVAYPPGWYESFVSYMFFALQNTRYPTATINGTPQFSTFAQYFSTSLFLASSI